MFGSIFSGEASGSGEGDGELAGICPPGISRIFSGVAPGEGVGPDAGVGVGEGEGMGIAFMSIPGMLPMSSCLGLSGCFLFCGVGVGLLIPGMLDMSCP
jgi:hypothetical protein